MKQQLMISTSSSGRLIALVMGRNVLTLSVLVISALVAFGVWGAYGTWQSGRLALELEKTSVLLQQARTQQAATVASLQGKLQIEQHKSLVYTRALGELQAKMTRLDALGSRLVDVASLDKSEFDFGMEPALGGLRQPGVAVDAPVVQQGVAQVDARLKQMDAQFTALDYMLESKRTQLDARPHTWPTKGGWISSGFGPRIDPFTGGQAMHYGVDIANKPGAPVLASSAGVVSFAGKMQDFGYVVDVDHGYGYSTRYAHMSSLSVKIGDVVEDRQKLGRVGSTGHSTGPHIHYEVRHYGKLVNPRQFLPRG
ncbi:M23 family metallopeptidase [Mariprofundus ferrooxydans]|uniref:M23 family metallopeptidase n=1 Tax=Mariprofundus ferrooxydans TaxID=314344 RepID=UPI00037B52EE|nr:M23 family metallopeptidase [Mariprofundus ferrooxydans]